MQRLATYHDDQPAAAGTTHPPTPPQQESKLLQIARNEPRILKMIVTYLGINDKQSLMFAVTEENYKLEKEENHLSLSNSSDMVTGGKGISGSNGGGAGSGSSSGTTTLAEDIYHRELEELDHIRSEYLTQLAQTREYESKMDDLQQQIDRAKLILHNNPDDSGDLLLLNYMASRLYLLKELTSRDYDDFFTARAQYSSWCNEQQQLYLQLGKESLFYQKKYLKISKLIQKLSFEQTKRFLYQITLQPLEPTPFLDSLPTSYTDSSPPPNPPQLSSNTSSSSHTYGSDQGNKKTIQFRVRTKLSFEKLTEEGKHLVSKYSNNFGHTPHVSPRPAISSLSNTPRATSSPMERSQSMERSVSSPQITPRVELPSPVTNAPVSPSPSPIENLGSLLSEFERELTVSLSEYEQNVCDTMENLSQMSLEAIRKKFINLNDTNGQCSLFLLLHHLLSLPQISLATLRTSKGELKRKGISSQLILILERCVPQPCLLPDVLSADGAREYYCGVRRENSAIVRVAPGAADEQIEANPGEILTRSPLNVVHPIFS